MRLKTRELACYLAVGGMCAVGQNATIIAASWAGYPYLLANILSAIIFVPLGYFLQSQITFSVAPSLAGLARFLMGVAIGLPLSSAMLWMTHGVCAIPIEIASPFVTVVMAVYGFLMARWGAKTRSYRSFSGVPSPTVLKGGR